MVVAAEQEGLKRIWVGWAEEKKNVKEEICFGCCWVGIFLGYVELGREWERKEKGNVVLIGPKILDVKIIRIKLMVGPSLVEIGRIVLSYLGQ